MIEITGKELNAGDWIAISANVSTSSQAILFGYVTKVTQKRAFIVRQGYWGDYDKTYMSNANGILKIPLDMVPKHVVDGINDLIGTNMIVDSLENEGVALIGKSVFVLMLDSSMTTFSSAEPFGVAVISEDDTQKFKKSGYRNDYDKVTIFENVESGLPWLNKDRP